MSNQQPLSDLEVRGHTAFRSSERPADGCSDSANLWVDSIETTIAAILPVLGTEWIKPNLIVEMINDVGDVPFEAVLFDPLREVLRQEMLLILIVLDEIRCHR